VTLIQRVSIQQRLQRGLHLKSGSPAPHLAKEVVGVVIVDDLTKFDGQQLDPPVDYVPCWARATSGALAANFSKVRLINPLDPRFGVMNVLEGVYVVTVGDFLVSVMPAVGGSVTGHVRDLRIPGASVGNTARGLTETAQSAVNDFPVGLEYLAVGGASFVDLAGAVIPPNFMISIQTAGLNVGITASFLWREYAAVVK
jgi:hypothetical protein